MRHFSPLPFAALVFALGCGDQPVTAPDSGSRGPRFGISDGAHSGGNDGFFFLPPVVKEPVGNPEYKDEGFHGGMKPHVRIWALPSAAPCLGSDPPFKDFAPEQILVADEKYHVNWDTKEKPLVDGVVYRIVVCVGDVLLGYADVEHASNRAELKNINTDEFVALVDGRTLPIKFRIETGALCQFDDVCTSTFVDKDIGGTFYATDQGAAIDFSPSVLPVDVVVTIERIPVPPGAPCVGVAAVTSAVFQQWEGCYRITTSPDIAAFGGFQGPTETNPARAIVAVCIEPGVPASVRDNLVLHKFDADGDPAVQRPEPVVPPFAFPCEGFEGTPSVEGALTGFARDAFGVLASAFTRLVGPRPLYAVDGGLGCILAFGDALSTFFWGLPVTAEASSAITQETLIGTAVPIVPQVTVLTFHADAPVEGEPLNEPVAGVPVRFTVTAGGGTLRDAGGAPQNSVDVLTTPDGLAKLPTGWVWEVGSTVGTNTVVASGPFVNADSPPTFTALAVAPDWTVESVTLAPASFPNTLDLLTYAIVVRNIGQTPTPATTLSFASGAPGAAALTLPVGTLGVGDAQTITTPGLTIATAGQYVASATVDPSNERAEVNESNNSRSLTYTIGPPPDLVVGSFTVSPSNPTVADALMLTAAVRNDGTGTARATELMIDFGGESLLNAPRFAVPSLAAGATHVINRPLARQVAQTYINNAVADVNNAATETNETNNALGLTFRVDDLLGSVSDPSGDATVSTISPSPDLVSASIEVDGGNATLRVRFAEGTFSTTRTRAGFHLDIDQNPATGSPGVDAGTNDDGIIGEDFLVNIGSAALDGQADIVQFFTGGGFTRKRFGTVTVVTNGLDVTIPLAELGGDEGRMNFKVTVQSLLDLEGTGFTGIVDYMADVGLPPTTVERRPIIATLGANAWDALRGRAGAWGGLD